METRFIRTENFVTRLRFNSLAFYLLAVSLSALSPWLPTVSADTTEISFQFPVPVPADVTIHQGDSVRWVGPSGVHPLQQVEGAQSDVLTSGGFTSQTSPFAVQFDTPGTYYYRCGNHGVFAFGGTMRGSIVVLAGAAPTATPTSPAATATPANCNAKPAAAQLLLPSQGGAVKSARVSLDWEDVACATSYRVVVRKGSKSGSIVDQKTATKSTYKTISLSKGTFFWNVKSCNTNGCTSSKTLKFSH